MINIKDNLYAVSIPIDATDVFFDNRQSLGFTYNGELRFVHIEPGSYEFLFCTKDATEEEAKAIVDSAMWYFPEPHVVYVNYAMPVFAGNRQGWNEAYNNAIASLRSLLASKGLGKPNYAILKKVG